MSESDRRYDATQSGQPTEVVDTGRHDPGVFGAAPAAYPSPRSANEAVTGSAFWSGDDEPPARDGTATQPDYRDAPVAVRRADTLAGLLLLLAGIAAGISLLVVWVHGGMTGLELVRDGVDDLDTPRRLAERDTWEPLAVVFGGVALFTLGLLMFVHAKTHRFLGVLALLVSLVVAAGVLVPLADLHWDVQRWAVGAWFAVGVGGLGFLGALKGLMTGPKIGRRLQ
jgi:hypothetical protein